MPKASVCRGANPIDCQGIGAGRAERATAQREGRIQPSVRNRGGLLPPRVRVCACVCNGLGWGQEDCGAPRKPARLRGHGVHSQWEAGPGSRAGLGQGVFGGQARPSAAAPEPLSLNHTRWTSSRIPPFSQSPLAGVTKHMFCSDKV